MRKPNPTPDSAHSAPLFLRLAGIEVENGASKRKKSPSTARSLAIHWQPRYPEGQCPEWDRTVHGVATLPSLCWLVVAVPSGTGPCTGLRLLILLITLR